MSVLRDSQLATVSKALEVPWHSLQNQCQPNEHSFCLVCLTYTGIWHTMCATTPTMPN